MRGLRGAPSFAQEIEAAVSARPGVRMVSASPLTGKVLVLYEPSDAGPEPLLDLLAALEAPPRPAAAGPPDAFRPGPRRSVLLAKALQPVTATGLLLAVVWERIARPASAPPRSDRTGAFTVFASAVNGYVQLRWLTRSVVGRRAPAALAALATEYASIFLKGSARSLSGLAADAGAYLFQFLEMSALRRAQRSTEQLLHPRSEVRALRAPGREARIPVSDLRPGDRVRLAANERVPADGVIEEAAALVDEAIITNRAFLSHKRPGDSLFLGTRVVQGAPLVRITATGRHTRLGRFLAAGPLPSRRALPGALVRHLRRAGAAGIAAAAFALPVTGSWRRALGVLAALNPNTVTMSALAANGAAIEAAARANVRIRRRTALATLARVDVLLFGKTGTLTAASPSVDAVVPFGDTAERLLALAASAMRASTHHLAPPVLERALKAGIDLPPAEETATVAGRGVRATVGRAPVLVGAHWWVREQGVAVDAEEAIRRMREQGDEVLCVARGGRLAGLIGLRERLLPGARETVRGLRAAGLRDLGVLSADPTASAARLADELGIERVWSGVDDEQKRTIVARLQAAGHVVAVVGASVSDMPAMAAADLAVGFAGPSWTPAPHVADVTILQSRLDVLPGLVSLARRLQTAHRQNVVIATAVSALGAAAAFLGVIPFMVADELNHVLLITLVANARRLSLIRVAAPDVPAPARVLRPA